MLPYDSWLSKAELLQEGQRRRIDHDCGPGRTLIIAHSNRGYSAHCFRCNDDGFKAHGLRTLDQLLAAKEARRYAELQDGQAGISLPQDYTKDIPKVGRLWYWRAGVTDGIARLYGFGWSDRQQRVVIPVRNPASGDLAYVQSRAVRAGDKPKYLNVRASNRTGVAFLSDPRTIGYYSRPGAGGGGRPEDQDLPGSRIVLCEDILSAIRVGMSTQAGAVLGTSLDDAFAAKLCAYERVTFWLDGDKAGIKGRLQGLQTLRLVHPGQVDFIESPSDPKCYSQAEIEEFLNAYPMPEE